MREGCIAVFAIHGHDWAELKVGWSQGAGVVVAGSLHATNSQTEAARLPLVPVQEKVRIAFGRCELIESSVS